MPVGQLVDRTNIIVFRSSGGTIFHEVTGNLIGSSSNVLVVCTGLMLMRASWN